jgi:N-glycosylase/DNA lyase
MRRRAKLAFELVFCYQMFEFLHFALHWPGKSTWLIFNEPMRKNVGQILIEDDFDLEKIASSGQCFRPRQIEGGAWMFVCGSHVLLIAPADAGAPAFAVSCSAETWQRVWVPYFDLARNYAAIRAEAAGQVPFLDAAMATGAGLRILRQDPWEMLVSFIISQRKSIPAIRTSVEALCTNFGQELPVPALPTAASFAEGVTSDTFDKCKNHASDTFGILGGGQTVHAFPTPDALCRATDAQLASCGLGYRVPYVRSAAQMVQSGEIDLEACAKMPDEQLFLELQCVHGVGKKVANCVCLFAFGRTAMVPIDVWIQRVIDEECAGQNPFLQFGNAAGIMQQYAFYHMTN